MKSYSSHTRKLWRLSYKSFKTSWEYPHKIVALYYSKFRIAYKIKVTRLLCPRSTRLSKISEIKAAIFLTTCWIRWSMRGSIINIRKFPEKKEPDSEDRCSRGLHLLVLLRYLVRHLVFRWANPLAGMNFGSEKW